MSSSHPGQQPPDQKAGSTSSSVSRAPLSKRCVEQSGFHRFAEGTLIGLIAGGLFSLPIGSKSFQEESLNFMGHSPWVVVVSLAFLGFLVSGLVWLVTSRRNGQAALGWSTLTGILLGAIWLGMYGCWLLMPAIGRRPAVVATVTLIGMGMSLAQNCLAIVVKGTTD